MLLNVCIFGVSGYTGSKLLELLCKHDKVKIVGVFGEKSIGTNLKDKFPKIHNTPNLIITNFKEYDFAETDLIFSCLPHGKFQSEIASYIDSKISVIDLSGDFRLKEISDYKKFYKTEHNCSGIIKNFVYGLSEINYSKIINSKFIANPGCYPTSILIPIIPLIKNNFLEQGHIVIDSKSGVSGAGKTLMNEYLFSELSENFYSYSIFSHKHYPEISQEIGIYNKQISFSFIPHLLPIFSGIQSTIYLDKVENSADDYNFFLKDYFKDSPFVKIYPDNKIPRISDVKNTNNIAIKIFEDFSSKKIIIISCLDNLIKGAAGQAIQNMNIMNGFEQSEALI